MSAYNAILHAAVLFFVYGWERSSARARYVLRVVVPLAAVQMAMYIGMIHFRLSRSTLLTLAFFSQQAIIPNVIVAAAFLAKFRYADVLLKRSLNLMLSVVIATLVAWNIPGIGEGIPVVVVSLSGAALLMASPRLFLIVSRIVDRALLRRPDYSLLLHSFRQTSGATDTEMSLFQLTEKTVRDALQPAFERIAPVHEKEPAGAERFSIRAARGEFVLFVSPGENGARLLKEETDFLHSMAEETGRRLDALVLERERRSLTEAELRALRAQVDPHFLFNTLNTIADLITADPAKAETMTERLADFFRYTLSRTERTLTTLEQEFQFVRDYLDIEQVRFGSRLRVELSAGNNMAHEIIPALILQPLVENAIRHGLAPKPEGGSISVSAAREGRFVCLKVTDNGVGMRNGTARSEGIGLENVRKRLRASYGDAARMDIETSLTQGTCVSLLLPCHDS